MSSNASANVERQINQIYTTVFRKVYNRVNMAQLARGNRADILQTAAQLTASDAYNEFAAEFAKQLAKKGLEHQRGIWRKFYQAARALHYVGLPKTWTEFERQQYRAAITENFKLIKTIPQKTLEILNHKYTTTLIEQVAMNKLPRGSFEKQLRQHGATNARVIARTEAAKLQTSIYKGRATALGSVAYRWRASNDKRTRASHRAMNGVIVFWRNGTEKPYLDKMYGDAGEFPNCRCSPFAIFDESDLTASSYLVYNYKTHKIIDMRKRELLDALKRGEL